MRILGGPVIASAAALAISACAGNGAGLDSNGRPIVAGAPTTTPLTADFASIQANVFTPICSVCHAGAAAPEGLRLDAANSYSLLVGVPSTEDPSVLRVDPGNPSSSYVIQKLHGTAAVGAQMPYGGPPLPDATIAVIAEWISAGAAQSSAPPTPAFEITGVSPVDGEVVHDANVRIVVRFSHELNPGDVTEKAVQLVRLADRAAPNGLPDTPRAVDLLVPRANALSLVVSPRTPLPPGRYQLRLDNERGYELRDSSGERLTSRGMTDESATIAVAFELEAAQ